MRHAHFRPVVAALCLALLSGCMATRLTTEAQLPPPLIERLPIRVGIYYSREFREYVHRETRGTLDYEINLGAAHVTNLDWLLKAMFAELVPVEDPTQGRGHPPAAHHGARAEVRGVLLPDAEGRGGRGVYRDDPLPADAL